MLHTIETFLPVFPGFYGTLLEPDEERYIEDGKTYDDYRWDYGSYFNEVAKKSCTVVQEWLKEIGIHCVINFQSVQSPREYNFTNDSVNVEIKILSSGIAAIRAYLDKYAVPFAEYLNEHYSSYDGFCSSYSNDPADWTDFTEHKHKFGAVLDFILYSEYNTDNDINMAFYDAVEPYTAYIESELIEVAD